MAVRTPCKAQGNQHEIRIAFFKDENGKERKNRGKEKKEKLLITRLDKKRCEITITEENAQS